ncbi:MAG: YdjY domain-containing protein [Rubrivivax sp.]
MRRRLLAALALAAPAAALAQPAAPRVGDLKPLGQERYQVGRIVVDKRGRSFSVPGRVLVQGKPLEYLATTPGGMKAYETLFELDTTGGEFNLACILIGLEPDPRSVSNESRTFKPVPGPRVRILVSWADDAGKRRQVPAAELLLNPEAEVKPESVEWVYTGSPASLGGGRFTPDDTGTLIGFVHDPNTLIESVMPIGLGAYGSVRGHASLPATGTAVQLIVEAAGGAK